MKPFLRSLSILLFFFPLLVNAQADTTVEVRDDFFDPETLEVESGTTVKWENVGSDDHTTTSGNPCNANGTWDSALNPGDEFTRTFNSTGNFPYFCIPHCGSGMTGLVIVGPTSLEKSKLELSELELYPVPFEDQLTLDLGSDASEVRTVEVFDITGKQVSSISAQNSSSTLRFDASDWESGVYFLSFSSEDSQVTRKVVKR